jgi:hypothetical protein
VSLARRGFHIGTEANRRRLEEVGTTFAAGFNTALAAWDAAELDTLLETVPRQLRGFAYEGAAMAFLLLDLLLPWGGGRWRRLLAGPGRPHAYMVTVGAGWAVARLGRPLPAAVVEADPLLSWLAYDGCGFHDGYFRTRSSVRQRQRPGRLTGYALRAFDQGLGRSLWFVECGDVERLAATVGAFEPARRPDLWSGVGLAAAYAGAPDRRELALLVEAAGGAWPAFAQGVAFAAKARERAGTQAEHTERASVTVCGRCADAAAAVTDAALERLPGDLDVPAYEVWRQRVQASLAQRRPAR